MHVSLRPEDVTLNTDKPSDAENLNLLEGKVIDTVYLGSFLECRVDVKGHEINIQIDHFENLSRDQTVFLTFRADHALCLAN